MKIPLKAIVITIVVCGVVTFLKTSGIGDFISDVLINPMGSVPEVDIK